mgnify:CR=1 FL=1
MIRNPKQVPASGIIMLLLVLVNAIVLTLGYTSSVNHYWWLILTAPFLIIGIYHRLQKKHSILRNYPVIGYLRYLLENIRPEIRQYFFESDSDGKPFSRRQRSIVYQRAKDEKQTVAFGMQADPAHPGYEWVAHTNFPVKVNRNDLRIIIGNEQCSQPYQSSILNIGAMSYGALSKTAIQSLNEGARIGGFAHNTGEGGISPWHLKGGDLIWQIGTGYFGCRNADGNFDPESFALNATRPEVKMIEVKLSQGAKPGYGGMLPAAKNTEEIAAIRLVPPHKTIISPPMHSAFHDALSLLQFLSQLRKLSGGKPVGFKICLGDKNELEDICRQIKKTEIIPDFIVIDGAEGGTGAAPLEFTDHVGMPLHEALALTSRTLTFYGLQGKIKIIAAGKIISGYDILKALALGADACYSARGMMFSLGCIQALQCDSGKCPVGIATQERSLYRAIDVTDKKIRVANFHRHTINAVTHLMEACGFSTLDEIDKSRFYRRLNLVETKSFDEIYPDNRSELAQQISVLN